jgi:uncharacterized protein (TIGR04222 family)
MKGSDTIMPLGPFDWTGQPFLILFGALFVIATLVSFVVPALLRPTGREPERIDPDDLALLAGGRERLFSAAATRLLAAGTLQLRGKHFAVAPGGGDLAIEPGAQWSGVERGLRGHATAIEARLRRAGLLIDAPTLTSMRRWAAFPYLGLVTFGLLKLLIGAERGRPIDFLAAGVVVTALMVVMRAAGVDRRSHAGRIAVIKARRTHQRLRRAPTRAEMGLAVALFGTGILAGSEFAEFHKLRAASGDGGGGDTSGDGGCGGRCGGCS